MSKVNIDFGKTIRKMKPLHGVNNGPLTFNLTRDARPLFKEAGIPISRLHDTEYPFGSGEYVDVDCIFKKFDDDPENPENYNFGLTDYYLKAIVECGTKIIYRLGCSIEHTPVKPHSKPPKDYKKWAVICEHIIRHYNEGWADGFHFDIQYWEIWNEPNAKDHKMWGAEAKEFAEFYTVAANYLKEKFPHLKIGGPAFTTPTGPFLEEFFTEITKDGAHPAMDFFSWHGYIKNPDGGFQRTLLADDLLKRYGYEGVESIYDEWNYVKSWSDIGQAYEVIHSTTGMALNAALMATLQDTSCTAACYYDAQLVFENSFCGLFRTNNNGRRNGGAAIVEPLKPYYAFKAFNMLYRLNAEDAPAEIGTQNAQIADQVSYAVDDAQLFVTASRSVDGKKGAWMISSFADVDEELSEKEVEFNLNGLDEISGKEMSLYLLDEHHDLEKIAVVPKGNMKFTMKPYSVLVCVIE